MKTPARALRFLHICALVPFLGGIAACIVLNAKGHLNQPTEFALRRTIASDLTWALIVPGMCALVLSGAVLSWRARAGLLPRNWLGAKQILGALILGNGFLMIVPRVLQISALVASPHLNVSLAGSLQSGEDLWGGINLFLALSAFVLAVWKPGRGDKAGPSTGKPRPS